jgi:hypothetical protein
MTIKVNPDGSFEVTSIEEALELQRRIQGSRPRILKPIASKEALQRANGEEPSYDHEVFRKLRPLDGQIIDSEAMMTIIGAASKGGVGPKLHHLKAQVPSLGDVLHVKKDARGHTSWKVKFPA